MVGDSETDILTARAAGIPVIAVDFGYSERPVAEYKPDRLISHFAQLAGRGRRAFASESLTLPAAIMVNAVRLTARRRSCLALSMPPILVKRRTAAIVVE